MSEGAVEIKDLVKTYVDDRGRATFTAVKNISLHVENGEFMVLVGPSGCGKSTTLRMIAGLEKITSGTISIGSRVVNELETNEPKEGSSVPVTLTVDIAEPMGSESLVYLRAGTGNLIARIHGEHLFHLGEQVTVQLDLEKVSLFNVETEKVIR
jgi:ABC-type sugar transport system ATPase subunit